MKTRFAKAHHHLISASIVEAEKRTSAELLVEVVKSSGSYRDVDFLFGFSAAYLLLLVAFFSPLIFDPYAVLTELLCVFILFSEICRRTGIRRVLTSRSRRRRQVENAAVCAFHNLNGTETRHRTGVLLYCSILERELIIVRDLGADIAASRREWRECEARLEELRKDFDPVRFLPKLIQELGKFLEQVLPAGADDIDELPNAARFE